MYLFDLSMPNIKSEALAQECSERKIVLNFLQNSLKNNCLQDFLKLRCRLNTKIPVFTFSLYPTQGFSSENCKVFSNTFVNTNNFVEHLQAADLVKCYL